MIKKREKKKIISQNERKIRKSIVMQKSGEGKFLSQLNERRPNNEICPFLNYNLIEIYVGASLNVSKHVQALSR